MHLIGRLSMGQSLGDSKKKGNNMSEKKSTLQNMVSQMADLKRQMQESGKEALKTAFSEFFQAHPEAKTIVWVQFTPYFNDGDACTFRVNEMELKVDLDAVAPDVRELLTKDDSGYDDSYGYGEQCAASMIMELDDTPENRKAQGYSWASTRDATLRPLSEAERSLVDDFYSIAQACHQMSDALEWTFGDHAKVVANRDGFEVSRYSHD